MDEHNFGYGMTKAFLEKFAGNAAEKPAETFGAAWDYVFGWINFANAKKTAIRQKDFEDFLESISNNMKVIPDDHIQEPELSLIGPALESTKYYINEKDLRELFVNLISKAMDDRYNDDVYHAFVEIIKQLSPIDAYLLKKLGDTVSPLARYSLSFNDGGVIRINDYFIIDDFFSPKQTSISLNNLERLGIIHIPENRPLLKSNFYDEYENTNEYHNILNTNDIVQTKKSINEMLSPDESNIPEVLHALQLNKEMFESINKFKEIKIDKTSVSLTSFGKAFYKVCIIK